MKGAVLLALGLVTAVALGRALASRDASPSPAMLAMNKIVFAEYTGTTKIWLVSGEPFGPYSTVESKRLIGVHGEKGGPPSHITSFVWTPDSRSFYYWVHQAEGEHGPNRKWHDELWRMNVDGSARRRVARFTPPANYDGFYLSDLLEVSAYGTYTWRAEPLTRAHYSLSPDAHKVAFRRSGIDSSAICVRDAGVERDEEAARDIRDAVCFGDSFYSHPAWSPR